MSHITKYLTSLKQSGIERKIPNISLENAEFLKWLIRERKPEHILEIGTANGYSTLHFASVFSGESDGPTITTIEHAWNAHIEAVENFKNCKIKNIHAIWWDAKAVIPTLRDNFFDFIYIDAMKKEYLEYLRLCLPKSTSEAIIVIDDVEKFAAKMPDLYAALDTNSIPYELYKTDIDDSVMVLFAKDCKKLLHQSTE
jgi:predicted O-methyltransferase YrrM